MKAQKARIKAQAEKKLRQIWLILLSVVAVSFFISGLVMFINIHGAVLRGLFYLLTAIVCAIGVYKIRNNTLKFDPTFKSQSIFFNLGFVFMVFGHNLNISVWSFGIVLFSIGLVNKK